MRSRRLILDRIDLNILAILARDCRTSYRSVGSLVGITSKSVKSRVKSMVSCGIIEKFLVVVNPVCFGYRTVQVLVRKNNAITKDDVIARIKQFGILPITPIIWEGLQWLALIIKKSWIKRLLSH